VLVLRSLGLGDLLTSIPALRALRRACPEHELVLAAPAVLAPLVGLAGAADRVLDHSGLTPLAWSGPPPALAVNLHGRGPQSHRLLGRTSPGRLVGFACREVGHRGPDWDPDEHEVVRWCRLVQGELGVDADPTDLRVSPPQGLWGVPVPRAVVHPGAAHEARRWPAERFAEVARHLTDRGLEVLVTGGPGEVPVCDEVAVMAGLPTTRVLAGRTDLRDLAGVVAHARLVVCGDTGVAHLASAFATPSVVLFGPTAPSQWGPPSSGPHEVIWHGTGQGDPWADEVDRALLRVDVPEVLSRIDRLLGDEVTQLAALRTTPGSA
jgi:ADP-heptose:LPS heptosyltransferase